jgi:phosphatidylglycerol:prolipoprotein diacylglycerol transferase
MFAVLPYPHLDPVALRVGPLVIRWYGLAYVLAFIAAYLTLRAMIRRRVLRLPLDLLGDLVSWLAVGVVLGGRIGWWLFYHRNQGSTEPWYEPVAIWHGGMSFHGGLIGVCAVLAIWSWVRQVSFWKLADAAVLVTPIGLFFGRIANFINAELVGRQTAVSWGMVFPGDTVARHPSQLYEALLEGPLLLLILWVVWKRSRPRSGRIAALFLILYGLFRFAVEFTREPDPQLGFIASGWLTMGQLLSALLAGCGIVLWLIRRANLKSSDSDTAAAIQDSRSQEPPSIPDRPVNGHFAHTPQGI